MGIVQLIFGILMLLVLSYIAFCHWQLRIDMRLKLKKIDGADEKGKPTNNGKARDSVRTEGSLVTEQEQKGHDCKPFEGAPNNPYTPSARLSHFLGRLRW